MSATYLNFGCGAPKIIPYYTFITNIMIIGVLHIHRKGVFETWCLWEVHRYLWAYQWQRTWQLEITDRRLHGKKFWRFCQQPEVYRRDDTGLSEGTINTPKCCRFWRAGGMHFLFVSATFFWFCLFVCFLFGFVCLFLFCLFVFCFLFFVFCFFNCIVENTTSQFIILKQTINL